MLIDRDDVHEWQGGWNVPGMNSSDLFLLRWRPRGGEAFLSYDRLKHLGDPSGCRRQGIRHFSPTLDTSGIFLSYIEGETQRAWGHPAAPHSSYEMELLPRRSKGCHK